MRIYLDNCCYGRPTDDQTQDRIRSETEAVLNILKIHKQKGWELIGSTVINFELDNIRDINKRQKAYSFYNYVKIVYDHKKYLNAQKRVDEIMKFGIRSIDGLHLAMSEYINADLLLTTDDKFINAAKRTGSKVRVENPLKWLMEVSENE